MAKDEQEAASLIKSLRQLDEAIARYGLLPFVLLIGGLLFVIIGLVIFWRPTTPSVTFVKQPASLASQEKTATIRVDIAGAVEQPGVYQLPVGARVQDGLIAAGGLAKDADRDYVAKAINLAARLMDGGKVYIPFKSESQNLPLKAPDWQDFGTQAEANSPISQININTASTSQLEELPGVGPVTAEKIIKGRPYQTIEELREKKIVNRGVWEKIKDKITVF